MTLTLVDNADVITTPTAMEISTLYAQRVLQAGPERARMAEVQRLYDGDIVVPLPELNKNERDPIPNRAREGLKQFSQRISSSLPSLWCPPVRPGIDKSEKAARNRRLALLGWWGHSKLKIVMRQRARYLQGYGAAPAQIRWDAAAGVPIFQHRNPLTTFPAHLSGPEDMCPADCIFETSQPLSWLQRMYPVQSLLLSKPKECKPDQLFTILEYVDDQVCVLVALGQRTDDYTTPPPGSMAVELERYPNRADRCPVVIPRQISLSKSHGQFDGMYGMHQTEAMLTAMSIIATQKDVFGEYWLVASGPETPEIIQVPDFAEGIPGVVKNGQLQRMGPNPQFQTNITTDRLAAAQNEQAGLTSELQGQAGTNIRTGARAQHLLSNVIDFPIQEAQELFAESLQEENRIAIAHAKAYGEDRSMSFYVDWDGARGPVTYNPTETFETDYNRVFYPLAGADQAGLVISGGQRVGMGTLSKRSFMKLDPMVEDDELEHDQIIGEHLEEAMLHAVEQMAAASPDQAVFIARIAELVRSNKSELYEAIDTAHKEAQALQAQQAPPAAPEAQPGLGGPAQAMGGQAPPPDLASMLAQLRRPQQVTPQEQVVAGPTA